MNSSCAISPAICQKGQHQLRWSQVVRLHYHINNPSDYKWSVVIASDTAATAKKRKKEWVFQLQKNSSYPDIWEYWRGTNSVVMALQLISSHRPMVSTNHKRNQHSVWLGDLIQTNFPVQHSAFRAVCIMKAFCFQSSTHCQQSTSGCVFVSCSSQSHHLEQRFLSEELRCINPLCFLLSFRFNQFFSDFISHFSLPHTEQFQLPRFILT